MQFITRFMESGSTLFLKLVIVFMAIVGLAIATVGAPLAIMAEGVEKFFPLWFFLYLTIIPFYIALWQGMKLLGFVDKNIAFSRASIKALSIIKYCAIIMSVFYFACLALMVRSVALEEADAPGLVVLWAVFSCAPIVIAVFASLLQKVLQNVIKIKSENDLTV